MKMTNHEVLTFDNNLIGIGCGGVGGKNCSAHKAKIVDKLQDCVDKILNPIVHEANEIES